MVNEGCLGKSSVSAD